LINTNFWIYFLSIIGAKGDIQAHIREEMDETVMTIECSFMV
jgi:hypothetical protein